MSAGTKPDVVENILELGAFEEARNYYRCSSCGKWHAHGAITCEQGYDSQHPEADAALRSYRALRAEVERLRESSAREVAAAVRPWEDLAALGSALADQAVFLLRVGRAKGIDACLQRHADSFRTARALLAAPPGCPDPAGKQACACVSGPSVNCPAAQEPSGGAK